MFHRKLPCWQCLSKQVVSLRESVAICCRCSPCEDQLVAASDTLLLAFLHGIIIAWNLGGYQRSHIVIRFFLGGGGGTIQCRGRGWSIFGINTSGLTPCIPRVGLSRLEEGTGGLWAPPSPFLPRVSARGKGLGTRPLRWYTLL